MSTYSYLQELLYTIHEQCTIYCNLLYSTCTHDGHQALRITCTGGVLPVVTSAFLKVYTNRFAHAVYSFVYVICKVTVSGDCRINFVCRLKANNISLGSMEWMLVTIVLLFWYVCMCVCIEQNVVHIISIYHYCYYSSASCDLHTRTTVPCSTMSKYCEDGLK